MPRFDYGCSTCGVFERRVDYDRRDDQLCACGHKAHRLPHIPTVTVGIPVAFRESNRIGYTQQSFDEPDGEIEKRQWDEIGVGAQRT